MLGIQMGIDWIAQSYLDIQRASSYDDFRKSFNPFWRNIHDAIR